MTCLKEYQKAARAGDEVTVIGAVVAGDEHEVKVRFRRLLGQGSFPSSEAWIKREEIMTRAERPLQVGDKVKHTCSNDWMLEIMAIREDWAWTKRISPMDVDCPYVTYSLAYLRRADA